MEMKSILPISNISSQSYQKNDKPPTIFDKIWLYLRTQEGVKYGNDKGFYKNSPHILTYNASDLRSCLAPFLTPELTVCNSHSLWGQHIGLLFYALILQFLLANFAYPDTPPMGMGACSPGLNKNICSLNDILGDAKGEFRFLIAFILAGYVGISLAIWKLRRTNYASLCGNTRNIIINISSLLPIDKTNHDLTESRRTLGRWCILAYELAVLKSRGHMDSEYGRDFLYADGHIIDGEWEAMVPGDRHSTVFWWIQVHIAQLASKGHISAPFVQIIAGCVSSMRAQANDLMSSLDRDKPISYVSLCGLLVKINVFIFSTWHAVTWSIWHKSMGFAMLSQQSKWWVDMLVLLSWNMSYVALYDLGYMLDNPFHDRKIDVAHETIAAGIRRLANSLFEADGNFAPTHKEHFKR